MRTIAFLLPFMLLLCNCKQRTENTEPKLDESVVEVETAAPLSPVMRELLGFASITFNDTTDIDGIFLFHEMDGEGATREIDKDRAINLYKGLMKRSPASAFPIFEIKGTEMAILPVQGKGYGGPIWAKILVDRTTLEINKIAFEHKAESDGYGAAISGTTFENQFEGKKIDLEKSALGLADKIERSSDEGNVIEGISGATMTSDAAVDMVNNGIKRYRKYLNKKP